MDILRVKSAPGAVVSKQRNANSTANAQFSRQPKPKSIASSSSGGQLREAVWQWFASVLGRKDRETVLTVVDKVWCDFLQALAKESNGREGLFDLVDGSSDDASLVGLAHMGIGSRAWIGGGGQSGAVRARTGATGVGLKKQRRGSDPGSGAQAASSLHFVSIESMGCVLDRVEMPGIGSTLSTESMQSGARQLLQSKTGRIEIESASEAIKQLNDSLRGRAESSGSH